VISISQRSEELRLYNVVWNLTVPNPQPKFDILKCISWLSGLFSGW
jgi:hypothetical protein